MEGASLSDRQARMRAVYAEIQEQAHGPEYLTIASSWATAAKAGKPKEATVTTAAAARPKEAAAAIAATTATGLEQRRPATQLELCLRSRMRK